MAAGIVLVFISNMVYSTLARTMSKPEIEKEFLSLLLRKSGLRIAPNSQNCLCSKAEEDRQTSSILEPLPTESLWPR
jgi:hypothetical protein